EVISVVSGGTATRKGTVPDWRRPVSSAACLSVPGRHAGYARVALRTSDTCRCIDRRRSHEDRELATHGIRPRGSRPHPPALLRIPSPRHTPRLAVADVALSELSGWPLARR